MKPQLLCLLCTFRAAYDLAKKSTDDEHVQTRVVIETIKWLVSAYDSKSIIPAVLHTQVCKMTREITGNADPFQRVKEFSNDQTLKMLPALEKRIDACRDTKEAFQLAVRTAICGNAIDFEVEKYDFSLEKFEGQFLGCLEEDLAIDHTFLLMQYLERSSKVLYLLDNAGEIVFDKLLIGLIKRTYRCGIWAVVKEKPVMNDAVIEDAEQVGLTSVAHVITTGNDHIGIQLDSSSHEFLSHLNTCDLMIAKGQGYYETLTEIESLLKKPICYLLRAKCPVVAEDLGVPSNSGVAKFSMPKMDKRLSQY